MTFNALKEKGMPLEKQLRTWEEIATKPYNKAFIDCYSRTRQILMNGIEVEAWGFKHQFNRFVHNKEINGIISQIGRIEDTQQTTMNWLGDSHQSILETTLAYEQVAVDLTAWLSQNEPDKYVKETFDFGLLEDFDHLYRYSQFAYIVEDIKPSDIIQGKTDVIIGRPTQHHHNCNLLRKRKSYDKSTTLPQTKVNILTLLSAEQQTHNFYAEHGFMYHDPILRKLYAEIKDVEEEHTTMYESLIDSTETMYEKLLIHEFTEVCNYYTCLEDEKDEKIRKIWEICLEMELGHLQIISEIFKKYEKKDPESIIGEDIIIPSRFLSQKKYVQKVLENEADKRLLPDGKFTTIKNLPSTWASYGVQEKLAQNGAPSESAIELIAHYNKRDIIECNKELEEKELDILSKGLQDKSTAKNTVYPECLKEMIEKSK